jgi:predicted permease
MQQTKPFAAFSTATSNPLLLAIGRLRPDATVEQVGQRGQSWIAQWPRPAGSTRELVLAVTPSTEMRIGRREEARTFFRVLLVVCALVLLSACSNVANFLVGRAVMRRRELAMRIALGASRGRIFRQLLTEAAVLAVCAGVVGILVARELGNALATLPRAYLNLPLTSASFSTAAAVDTRMAVAAVLVGLATVLLFGLVPAVIASFRDPSQDLKNTAPHWSWSGIRITPRQVLVTLQVALAVALAVTAGLFLRSFARIVSVDSGYKQPESVLLARIVPSGITIERGNVFYGELLKRLNASPGVTSATIGWNLPFMIGQTVVSIPGRAGEPLQVPSTAGAPRYFETQGVRMTAGREYVGSECELKDGAIVNRQLAEQLWPNQDPIGQPIVLGRDQTNVIGVVDSRCFYLLGDPGPCVWRAFPRGTSTGYVRIRMSSGPPTAFAPTLRQIVRELNPDVAVAEEMPLDVFLRASTARERAAALASAGLALFGIVLLASGCVALFVSMVRDSVREIAIRMAIGASARTLTVRILLQGLALIAVGVAAGLAGARVIGNRLAEELYHTPPTDLLTFIAVPALVSAIALAAVLYSAFVATRNDPAKSLRVD